MGESSSAPWPGGVHRALSHPIGINTKPILATVLAGVSAHAVAAGIIASSRGRASAACAPFRNVRLCIAFLVRNMTLSSCLVLTIQFLLATCYFTRQSRFIHLSTPHLKRGAFHDSEYERRKPVVVFLGVFHDLANGRRVVVLDASSEREGQKG